MTQNTKHESTQHEAKAEAVAAQFGVTTADAVVSPQKKVEAVTQPVGAVRAHAGCHQI